MPGGGLAGGPCPAASAGIADRESRPLRSITSVERCRAARVWPCQPQLAPPCYGHRVERLVERHGAPDDPSTASAVSAMTRVIGAARALSARGRTYGKKTLPNTLVLNIKAAPPGSALGLPARTGGGMQINAADTPTQTRYSAQPSLFRPRAANIQSAGRLCSAVTGPQRRPGRRPSQIEVKSRAGPYPSFKGYGTFCASTASTPLRAPAGMG